MRASRRVLWLFAALSSVLVLLAVEPASAHTGFESSNPADGSTVDMPVEVVTIAYSGPAEPAGEGFVVLDSTGTIRIPDRVASDTEQQLWTLHFDPPLADGMVGVRWTVQAPDAHPIDGGFSFNVTATDVSPAAGLDGSEGDGSAAVQQNQSSEIASESIGADEPQSFSEGQVAASGSQDLQEFLLRGDQTAANAAGVATFGRLLGLVGTILGIGGLCFGAVVVRNRRRDLRTVLTAVRYAAIVMIAGTALDLAAHLAVVSNGWWEILTAGAFVSAILSPFGLAIGLRLAAGSLLFVTARITDQDVSRAESPTRRRELVLAGHPAPVILGEVPSELGVADRPGDLWFDQVPSAGSDDRPLSIGSVIAVVLLLVSFTFDGHTVTEGNRWITGAVDMVHVVAGAIWAGGVVAFVVVLWSRHRRREVLGGLEMALRFSVVGGAALAVAGLAGTMLAVIILESVSDLWTTPWGLLLIAKTAVVAAAASLGTYNHFVVVPWLNAHPSDHSRSVRLRHTVTAEAIVLAAVIVLTAFLVGAASQ